MQNNNSDPRHHVQKMQKRLSETIDHLRAGIVKVKDPQLKAMFETAAEVLEGLVKAFKGYEKKNEPIGRQFATHAKISKLSSMTLPRGRG
jgi:hypothetical protein